MTPSVAAIALPDGVSLNVDARELVDEVRGQSVPLNPSAALLVHRLLGTDETTVAQELAKAAAVDVDRVKADIGCLISALNEAALINVAARPRPLPLRWLRTAVPAMMLGSLPPMPHIRTHRRDIATGAIGGTLFSTARAFFMPAMTLALGLFLVTTLALVGVGGLPPEDMVVFLAIIPAVIVAVLAHEAGHAIALRGRPAAAVTTGLVFRLLHAANGPDTALVSIAGPLLGSAVGLAITIIAATFQVLWLAIAGLVITTQVVALSVVSADGRHALGIRPGNSTVR